MKSLLFASAALAVALGSANAQDASFTPAYDWSGLYLGAQAGGFWSRTQTDTTNTFPGPILFLQTVFGDEGARGEGFLGGVHAGYDTQFGNWVVGGVADIDAIDFDAIELVGKSDSVAYDIDWVASARLRAGYANDNMLFYVTGGLGFADVSMNHITGGGGDGDSYARIETGGVIGAGVEYGFTPQLSTKIEYLHYAFDNLQWQPSGSFTRYEFDPSFNVVKAGLSYRF